MDEVHRICRALLQGMDDIEAMQFLNDPEPDSIGVNPETYLTEDCGAHPRPNGRPSRKEQGCFLALDLGADRHRNLVPCYRITMFSGPRCKDALGLSGGAASEVPYALLVILLFLYGLVFAVGICTSSGGGRAPLAGTHVSSRLRRHPVSDWPMGLSRRFSPCHGMTTAPSYQHAIASSLRSSAPNVA